MKLQRITTLLIAIMAIIPVLSAASSSSTPPSTITLSTQYGTVYVGQNVVVHYVIDNNSGMSMFSTAPGNDVYGNSHFIIQVQDKNGTAIPLSTLGQSGAISAGPSTFSATIQSGATLEGDAEFSELYVLNAAGEYQVQFSEYPLLFSADGSTLTRSDLIQSNVLPFTLVEPTGAVITSPAIGEELPNATFTWNAFPNATSYKLLLSSTGYGSSDVYNSGPLTTTTVTVPDAKMPYDGRILYATLQTEVNGVWQSTNNTFFAAGTPEQASLTAPVPSSQLTSSTTTFTWWPGVGVNGYELRLGTTGVGSSNLDNSGAITATSYTSTNLPMNSAPIYARLYSKIRNAWQYTDYLYTAAAPQQPAVMLSPAPGTPLSSNNVTFQWSKGIGVTDYEIRLGTTGVSSSDIAAQAGVATSYTATNLPSYGATITATLYSKINGIWQSSSYNYAETGSPHAVLTTPTPGSQLSGTSATFTWTKGLGVTEYALSLGTTGPDSSDLGATGPTKATSYNATNLPTNGVHIFATLSSQIDGVWVPAYYLYIESGTPAAAALTAPTPSSKLTGSTVTFDWSKGTGVTEYELFLGTTGIGSSDLDNSGAIPGTTYTATNLPTNGKTVYARLLYKINGAWLYTDCTYTAQ